MNVERRVVAAARAWSGEIEHARTCDTLPLAKGGRTNLGRPVLPGQLRHASVVRLAAPSVQEATIDATMLGSHVADCTLHPAGGGAASAPTGPPDPALEACGRSTRQRHGPSFHTLMSLRAGRITETGSQPCLMVSCRPVLSSQITHASICQCADPEPSRGSGRVWVADSCRDRTAPNSAATAPAGARRRSWAGSRTHPNLDPSTNMCSTLGWR